MIILLVILLVTLFAYIGYNIYSKHQQEKMMKEYFEGHDAAIRSIFEYTSNCDKAVLEIDGQEIEIISLECLKKKDLQPANPS